MHTGPEGNMAHEKNFCSSEGTMDALHTRERHMGKGGCYEGGLSFSFL